MSLLYPRVPVRLPSWEEALRRCALAINHLLGAQLKVQFMDEINQVATVTPAEKLAPWVTGISSWGADDLGIDVTNGEITVIEGGLYELTAFFGLESASNNRQYLIELWIDDVFAGVIGTVFLSGGASATITATFIGILQEGQVLSFYINSDTAGSTVTVVDGQVNLKIMSALEN